MYDKTESIFQILNMCNSYIESGIETLLNNSITIKDAQDTTLITLNTLKDMLIKNLELIKE